MMMNWIKNLTFESQNFFRIFQSQDIPKSLKSIYTTFSLRVNLFKLYRDFEISSSDY